MNGKQRGKIDKTVIILAFLLFTCVAVISVNMVRMYLSGDAQDTVSGQVQVNGAAGGVIVTGGTIDAGAADTAKGVEQAVDLSLHSKHPEENVPFQLTNMFPGDSKTQYYRISVSYGKSRTKEFAYEVTAGLSTSAGNEYQNKTWIVDLSWWIEEDIISGTGTIRVNFQVTARNDDEKLSEMVEIKVRKADTGELLYDGALADIPIIWEELSTESGDDQTEPSEPGSGDDPSEPSEPEYGDDEESMTGTGGGSLTDTPGTGDDSRIMMWLVVLCVTMAAMLLVLVRYRRGEQIPIRADVPGSELTTERLRQTGAAKVQKRRRKLLLGIFLAVFLMFGLGITSLALVYQKVIVEENLFVTGNVSICLNDDQPVFNEAMLFEPGMVVKKDFSLRNDSTCDVHYRLYFTNVDGEFAETLLVEVQDGETVLFEGTLAGINGDKSEGADGILREGEERVMTIVFRVPEDCGNVMQGGTVLFDLNADAVQTVNNPAGMFE